MRDRNEPGQVIVASAMSVLALILSVLVAAYDPPPNRTYDLRGVEIVTGWSSDPTCGALPRMLKDRHRVTVKEGKYFINGKRWRVDQEDQDSVMLSFYPPNNRTKLFMHLVFDDRGANGTYMLFGYLENRKPCQDTVYIEGSRR